MTEANQMTANQMTTGDSSHLVTAEESPLIKLKVIILF